MSALDAANWEKYYPKDLIVNPTTENLAANTATDKNNFTVVVPNLKIDSTYTFQFQYVFEDGVKSDWSPGKFIATNTESVPPAPTVTVTGGAGFIKVSLPTFPANALRVDVRIAGGTFGTGAVVAESFTSAGVKTIAALGAANPGNAYVVTLLTVTPSKINGNPSSPVTVYVTDPAASIAVEPSVTPSTPTVSQVLGAIQLAWNGKTSSGGNQPAGFDAAKVYVGTSAGFTPVDTGNSGANQVDILNFANGQNTLNIAVGTVVNGTALTYGTDYYVKIKTTNGNIAQDSTAVAATGNPVQIGKVGSGDIVTVTADQITAGTIESQTITVGTSSGKHIKLNSSGNPLTIYGTGGASDPLLSFGTNSANESVLTIKGNGTFSGSLSAASGTFTGNITASAGTFSVNNGVLTAQSGTIGGWAITGSILESSSISTNRITLNPATPKIALISGGVEKITIDPTSGIVGPNVTIAGNTGPGFSFSPNGTAVIRGTIYANSGIFSGTVQTSSSSNSANTITLDGTSFRVAGSGGTTTLDYNSNIILSSTGSINNSSGSYISLLNSDSSTELWPGGVRFFQGAIFGSSPVSFSQYIYNSQLFNYAQGLIGITWASGFYHTSAFAYNNNQVSTRLDADGFRPLGITPFGEQTLGQRLFSGVATSNSAINTDINNRGYAANSQNGDFYFSTA